MISTYAIFIKIPLIDEYHSQNPSCSTQCPSMMHIKLANHGSLPVQGNESWNISGCVFQSSTETSMRLCEWFPLSALAIWCPLRDGFPLGRQMDNVDVFGCEVNIAMCHGVFVSDVSCSRYLGQTIWNPLTENAACCTPIL